MTEESKGESEPISISINRTAAVVRKVSAPQDSKKTSDDKKKANQEDSDDSSQSSPINQTKLSIDQDPDNDKPIILYNKGLSPRVIEISNESDTFRSAV